MTNRYACMRSRLAGIAAGVLAAALVQVSLASAAWAITATLSANEGSPGTRVTVFITDLGIPCEVRFDDVLVVPESGCRPSADGSASPTFTVPAEATAGNHQVRVSARRPGSSSQLSNSFRVTASRSRPSSPAAPGPSRQASPSPTAAPSTSPTPTPSPSPSPTASPGAASPSEPSPGTTLGGGPVGSEDEAEAGSGIPPGIVALIAVGAGLTVAAGVYFQVGRKGRG